MLHSLPAMLDELEHRLVQGEDPLPLIQGIKWTDVIDWPRNRAEALRMKERLNSLQSLIQGLDAPIRATLLEVCPSNGYQASGGVAPSRLAASKLHGSV